MTNQALLSETHQHSNPSISELLVRGWSWKTSGAVFGLGIGILSPVLGSVLTVFTWFAGPNWHGLHFQTIGTVLLFLTAPLLVFGAHCLDLIDRENKKQQ